MCRLVADVEFPQSIDKTDPYGFDQALGKLYRVFSFLFFSFLFRSRYDLILGSLYVRTYVRGINANCIR